MTAQIVTLDSARIIARLNSLPPNSRLRPGYVDMMRQIRREELANDHMTEMLAKALELAFEEDDGFAARTQEAW